MKRLALLAFVILAVAAPAFAQYPDGATGDVSAYADDQGNSCDVAAPGGGGWCVRVTQVLDGGGRRGAGSRSPSGRPEPRVNTQFVPIGNAAMISPAHGLSTRRPCRGALFINATASPACWPLSVAWRQPAARSRRTACRRVPDDQWGDRAVMAAARQHRPGRRGRVIAVPVGGREDSIERSPLRRGPRCACGPRLTPVPGGR
jgi:hypothetical protein